MNFSQIKDHVRRQIGDLNPLSPWFADSDIEDNLVMILTKRADLLGQAILPGPTTYRFQTGDSNLFETLSNITIDGSMHLTDTGEDGYAISYPLTDVDGDLVSTDQLIFIQVYAQTDPPDSEDLTFDIGINDSKTFIVDEGIRTDDIEKSVATSGYFGAIDMTDIAPDITKLRIKWMIAAGTASVISTNIHRCYISHKKYRSSEAALVSLTTYECLKQLAAASAAKSNWDAARAYNEMITRLAQELRGLIPGGAGSGQAFQKAERPSGAVLKNLWKNPYDETLPETDPKKSPNATFHKILYFEERDSL